MRGLLRTSAALVAAAVLTVSVAPAPAVAGTTGSIVGRIVDQKTGAPVTGAAVTAASPSQTERSVTDAGGGFRVLSLLATTYTVTVERASYDALILNGVTVQADQTQTLNRALASRLQTIGSTTARRS